MTKECHHSQVTCFLQIILYEKSWLNLCNNTGPANLLYFLPACRYLVFNLMGLNALGEVSDVVTSSGFFKDRYHLNENETQFFFAANPFQRLNWQKESVDNMKQTFECIERELSTHE